MLDWIWVQVGVSRLLWVRMGWLDTQGVVSQVVVSHPRSLAWIGKDTVKDDKVDAGKLAELLRLGQL